MKIAAGILLTVCAVLDLRKKEVPVRLLAAAIAAGTVLMGVGIFGKISGKGLELSVSAGDQAAGLAVGLAVLAVARMSRGQLGEGDGLTAAAAGLFLGGKRLLALLFGGMTLFLLAGAAGIAAKKWTARQRLAFLPFLWLAYAGETVLGALR